MAKKKLSTAEILAKARAEAKGGKAPETEPTTPSEPAAPTEPAQQQEAAEQLAAEPAPKPQPAGKPKSTQDILAAARAQVKGGKEPAEQQQTPEQPTAEPAPKPKPAGKPKSTKDILAAARAQVKGGEKPAAQEAVPKGAPKPAPKAAQQPAGKTAAAPSGPKPSVQEMLRAAREAAEKGRPPVRPEEAARPKKPAERRKPTERAAAPRQVARRSVVLSLLLAPLALFSSAFSTAWTLFTAACAAFTLAMARFMMPNVLVEPPSKFKVGQPSDYPLGTVSTKWKSQYGIWVVHAEYKGKNILYALISVCTHLGCTPNWLEGEQKFKCPCHGSGFYISGINFEGPAPRPLERAAIRIGPDGLVEVDKSQTFQQELGEWEDPASYVEMV